MGPNGCLAFGPVLVNQSDHLVADLKFIVFFYVGTTFNVWHIVSSYMHLRGSCGTYNTVCFGWLLYLFGVGAFGKRLGGSDFDHCLLGCRLDPVRNLICN